MSQHCESLEKDKKVKKTHLTENSLVYTFLADDADLALKYMYMKWLE